MEFLGKVSADVGFGKIWAPYNGSLYDAMPIPEDQEPTKTFLQDVTQGGSVFDVGANFHWGKNYVGGYFQRITLNGEASYQTIIESELFRNEFTAEEWAFFEFGLETLLPAFGSEVNLNDLVELNTKLSQLGVKYGRRFPLANKHFEIRAEFGITMNLSSETEIDYDDQQFDEAIEAYEQFQLYAAIFGGDIEDIIGFPLEVPDIDLRSKLALDDQAKLVDEFFEDYGFIPFIGVSINYRIFNSN